MNRMMQHFRHGLCIHVKILFVSGIFWLVFFPQIAVAGLWGLSCCRKNFGPVFQFENVALQGVKPQKAVL